MAGRPNRSPIFVLAVVLVLGGLLALLFVPNPFPSASLLQQSLLNMLHLPFFAAVTVCIYLLVRRRSAREGRRGAPIRTTAIIAAALAIGSEALQVFFRRDFSGIDSANNLFGIAAALTGVRLLGGRTRRRWAAFVGAVVGGLAVALLPTIRLASELRRLGDRLPVLGDFERDRELLLWSARGAMGTVPDHATSGKRALRIDTKGTSWAGVRLTTDGMDWSGYSALVFDAHNAGAPFTLGIRMDLRSGLQYSGAVELASGQTGGTLRFESLGRTREIPFDDVIALVFHTGESTDERTFFLDNVRLE